MAWPSLSLAWWRRMARTMRTPLLLFLLLFGWLQLLLPRTRLASDLSGGGVGVGSGLQAMSNRSSLGRDLLIFSYTEFLKRTTSSSSDDLPLPPVLRRTFNASRPNGGNFNWTGGVPSAEDRIVGGDYIRWRIRVANSAHTVYNEDRYGPVSPDAVVFVVQVHDRRHYLRYLIESFREVRGIETALIVFSHDHYDDDINSLVQSIDFARVMQIFYPYSTQLYVNEFPGQDPNDCPWDMKKETAIQLKCNNAHYPDLYGHYREAKYTQIKHHWWWKLHLVFDSLRVTRNGTGLVVFLEEDHYVTPDVVHVLGILESARRQHCAHCNIISLGTYMKSVNFASDSQRVEVSPWIASKHNMGMVLRRENWDDIRSCADKFCAFDDYNWDWSLQHLSSTCLHRKLTVLMTRAPRVFHIGECGVHHKEKNCSSDKILLKVRQAISNAKDVLFPSKLSLARTTRRAMKPPKGNGGWGDPRDRWLCMHLVNGSAPLPP